MKDCLADESAEQRETRLQQVREQMRDCLADESAEQRKARLQQMREQMRNRLADESVEQREVRLQQMSDSQRERMAAETAVTLCYHFFIFIHSHRFNLINLSSPQNSTLHSFIHST